MKNYFTFTIAQSTEHHLIQRWVQQPHIREWLHGEGLCNTLLSLVQSFDGPSESQHWIAYDDDTPFGYLLTSERDLQDEALSAIEFSGDKAISLDVFIGEPTYLGRGVGTQMLGEFLRFLQTQWPDLSDVLIDPEVENARAVHVYQKLGFQIVDTFIASWHPVPHYLMHLDMVKTSPQFLL